MGVLLLIMTLIRPHRTESILMENQNNFNITVKSTTVEIEGQILRFRGLVISEKSDQEEVIVSYKLSSEEEKTYFEENGVPPFLKIEGRLTIPNESVNFHQFSYKEYLLKDEIFYKLIAEKLEKQKVFKEMSISYKIDRLRSVLFKQIDI